MLDVIAAILLVFLSLIFNKSKFICIVFFIFIYTLAGWNTWNGDYDAYERLYNNSILLADDYEPGYVLINTISNMLGISYQSFLQVFYAFILSVFAYAGIKYSRFPALYSAIYFFIFILEYVFLRNYLTHSLLLLAFIILIKEIRFYKFWFVVLILTTSTIHTTAIVWLIFLFTANVQSKTINIRKYLILFFVLTMSSFFLLSPVLSLLGGTYIEKVNAYLNKAGLTTVFFVHPLIVFLVYNYFRIVLNNGTAPPEIRRWYYLVINVNILSLIYISLYIHIPYFARFLRFLFAFDIIFMLNAFFYINVNRARMNMILTFCLLCLALGVTFYKSTHLLATYPLFKNNALWGDQHYIPEIYYE